MLRTFLSVIYNIRKMSIANINNTNYIPQVVTLTNVTDATLFKCFYRIRDDGLTQLHYEGLLTLVAGGAPVSAIRIFLPNNIVGFITGGGTARQLGTDTGVPVYVRNSTRPDRFRAYFFNFPFNTGVLLSIDVLYSHSFFT